MRQPRSLDSAADALGRCLRAGRIDRSQFTSNANGYFSAQALADFQASLGPLGAPKEFKHAGRGSAAA